MPRTEYTCCFCFDIRIGCLIIAYIRLVVNCAMPLYMILNYNRVIADLSDGDKETSDSGYAIILFWIIIASFSVSFGYNVALLVGLHEGKRSLVRAFYLFAVLLMLITIITFICKIVQETTGLRIGLFVITSLLQLYVLLIIRNYLNVTGERSEEITNDIEINKPDPRENLMEVPYQ